MATSVDQPKIENTRYSPSAQAMLDASREANEQWPKAPGGVTMQTKSGAKHIRVRRCTRTVKLSGGITLQCQRDQHNADLEPIHKHVLTVFAPDGTAKEVTVLWKDLGPMSPLVLPSKKGMQP